MATPLDEPTKRYSFETMKDLPKGEDKVSDHIFRLIWHAEPDQRRVATEAFRKILNSFQGRENGRELADGLIEVVDYYTLVGYWRGPRRQAPL